MDDPQGVMFCAAHFNAFPAREQSGTLQYTLSRPISRGDFEGWVIATPGSTKRCAIFQSG